MVRLILVVLISLSPQLVHAEWFTMQSQIQLSSREAIATIYNDLSYPLHCKGKITGVTNYGCLYEHLNVAIVPGQSAYVYVYTDNRTPFVDARSEIQCKRYKY